jgi:hypothetical protein
MFNRHSNWFVASILVIFFGCNWFHALRTSYWFDELFTLHISQLGLDGIWRALAAPADGNPPLFFLISRMSAQTLGWSSFGLRLPALLGFLVMMLCIYCIVREYTTPVYATVAMLGSYFTRVPAFAIEARPYGLLLGFSSLALLFWMRAAQGRSRPITLTLLCLSLAGALSCHYFAALTFFGIAMGEAARVWTRKRVDWPIVAAFAFASTPPLLYLPLVRASATFKAYAFARPTLGALAAAIGDLVLPLNGILIISLAVLVSILLRFGRGSEAIAEDNVRAPKACEWVAWMALALAPVEALVLAKLVHGTLYGRYFIVFAIGFSILLAIWAYGAFRHYAPAGLAMLCLCLFWFAVRNTIGSRRGYPSTEVSSLIQDNNPNRLPVAVADGIRFYELAYYAPDNVRSNLVYLIDLAAASRYTGSAQVDQNLKGLRGIAPLNLPDYSEFVNSHKTFLVLWGEGGWLPLKLNAEGARIVFKGKAGVAALYLVEF